MQYAEIPTSANALNFVNNDLYLSISLMVGILSYIALKLIDFHN